MKAIDMRCILFIIRSISISEITIGESAASALERQDSLTTFNEDDCVLSVCDLLSVSFAAVY